LNENNSPEAPAVIHWRIAEWFPDLTPEILGKLKTYQEELIKFSKTVNLVSPKTIPMADVLHFADSILASRIISRAGVTDKIYDFGSGNGFPGMIYGLLNPNTQVVLVDSDQRKCEFLKHIAGALKLKNVTVMNQTLETLPANSVKYAMARGYAPISKAILQSRHVILKGGSFFHLKSEEWGMEVSNIPTQLCSIWTPSLLGEYKLPAGPVRFAIVKTEKIA
jgi:16S rRNA (guanine527-N7)-methyltransferase